MRPTDYSDCRFAGANCSRIIGSVGKIYGPYCFCFVFISTLFPFDFAFFYLIIVLLFLSYSTSPFIT